MSRTDLNYADEGAAFVGDTSEAVIRARAIEYHAARTPARPLTPQERRANLKSLAEIVLAEAGWKVAAVVTPSWRPLLRYYAAVPDYPAFGRLLLAVAARCDRDIDAALERLVPAVAA